MSKIITKISEDRVRQYGNGKAIYLTTDEAEFLGITNDDIIVKSFEIGKKGKFLAVYKKKNGD